MNLVEGLCQGIKEGDYKTLARAITMAENEQEGYLPLLQSLSIHYNTPIIGITGPPGAGKSTLVSALLSYILSEQKKVAVLAVDPSSPFNFGALLGDRIRLAEHYTNPKVFIRSVAARGSLGGLSEKIIEITDIVRSAPFDYVIVETVGVGQSEVEIAGLADVTVVALVPESGDEVQAMKAGLMEIADIFVINKADHPEADLFAKRLRSTIGHRQNNGQSTPIIKTIATTGTGVDQLWQSVAGHLSSHRYSERKNLLMALKAYRLIQKHRMKDVSVAMLEEEIRNMNEAAFNLYNYIVKYYK